MDKWRFKRYFCLADTKSNDCKMFCISSWFSSKIDPCRLFNFSKTTCSGELWVMAHFWKISIYDSHMAYTYTIRIYNDSEFYGDFFAYKVFLNLPTQIFKYRFSLKCVSVIFFWPEIIWSRDKILNQMIWINMGLIVIRQRKGVFLKRFVHAHAIELSSC